MNEDLKLIPVQEYAEMVGKSRQAVLKAIKNGKLKAVLAPHPTVSGKTA